MFRTTLRLDLDKPASRQAATLLRQLHAVRGLSYSALIVPAVNAYYGKAPADESLRETIRSIVREELAIAPVQLGDLMQVLKTAVPVEHPASPHGTGIPACILVFKKGRTRDDVLFIDASGEGNYEKGKNQNLLRDSDIARIVSTYEAREAKVDKYSYRASRAEIRENDYNLNIPRYVDTFEEEELVDIDEVKRNIESIEAELSQVQAQMAKYMEELGL